MADNGDIYLKLITCEYEEMRKKAFDASSLPKDGVDNDDWDMDVNYADMNVNGDDDSTDEDMDIDMDVEEEEEVEKKKKKKEESIESIVILRYQTIIAKNKR